MDETAFVLIAASAPQAGQAVTDRLKRAGHACHLVDSTPEALESIRRHPPDVVVTEYPNGKNLDGCKVLHTTRHESPDTEVILLVEPSEEDSARKATAGEPLRAFDYVVKPVDPEMVARKVAQAAEKAIAARQRRMLKEGSAQAYNFEGLIGQSAPLAKEIKRVRKVARSKSTVLILGETGTGKELVAAAIHKNSPRAGKPFQVMNCAGLTETLLESELFGHVKGAFTGAIADKKGILQAADGGTLFLDEIGDMPLTMQAKLLRTLESGEVQPVGAYNTHHVDVRFVAATHRNLAQAVEQGRFREDLLYRLHAQGAIRIPPLRERREDIPLLVHHFIEKATSENNLEVEGISPEALRKLTNYSWPGNVRELRNVVEGMVIEAEQPMLSLEDLPEGLKSTTDIVPVSAPSFAGLSMAEVERLHIINTLRLTDGNREKAARILKISPRTLYRKLREYGLN
ncbi:MAG: sigma-54-dependent Fis family transcriptional regulator [Phycisphaerae bacterium]|nr:sigma-54-dependent Fis family transcriptional regulator [Phycisphaerae bacterium]